MSCVAKYDSIFSAKSLYREPFIRLFMYVINC